MRFKLAIVRKKVSIPILFFILWWKQASINPWSTCLTKSCCIPFSSDLLILISAQRLCCDLWPVLHSYKCIFFFWYGFNILVSSL